MFSLARNAVPSASRLLKREIPSRAFAQVVPVTQAISTDVQAQPQPSKTTHSGKGKVSVREDHGLYAFFRQKPNAADLQGGDKYMTLETPEMQEHLTGRDWKASELRLKSFRDLHTLWYVLLRERNLLATQKAEARRNGVDRDNLVSQQKQYCVRISMARIKAVLNERRLAYEGAVQLVDAENKPAEEEKILQYLETSREAQLKVAAKSRRAAHRHSSPSQLGTLASVEAAETTPAAESTPIPETEVVQEAVRQNA